MKQILFCVLVGMISLPSTFATMLSHNAFAYIGQLGNGDGSLTLGGYRRYQPATGRFLKQDSDSPFQGRKLLNGYQYSAGNPVLFEDQSGHKWNITDTALILVGSVGIGLFLGYGIRNFAMQMEAMAGPLEEESELRGRQVVAAREAMPRRIDRHGLQQIRFIRASGISLGNLLDESGDKLTDPISLEAFKEGGRVIYHDRHFILDANENRVMLRERQGSCILCRQRLNLYRVSEVVGGRDDVFHSMIDEEDVFHSAISEESVFHTVIEG